MTRHILLLRGVNVGGSHIVNMKELCAFLTEAGFARAQSYIGSGNLLLAGGEARADALRMIGAALERYPFDIPFAAIPFANYAREMAALPAWWREGNAFRRNVLFYLDGFDREKARAYLAEKPLSGERAYMGDLALFWQVDEEKGYGSSRYHRLMEAPFYRDVTIRNARTADRLLTLSAAFDAGGQA